MANDSYHRGNLRAVLVTEGIRLLTEKDAQAISLREIARAAGVTATSVYRHFPNKEALMSALAVEGLALLYARQREASAGIADDAARFNATGRAYVQFALENPALFRVIFSSPALIDIGADGLQSEAGQLLQANAASVSAAGGDAARAHAIHAWALVHGLSMLMLDRQITVDSALIDSIISM